MREGHHHSTHHDHETHAKQHRPHDQHTTRADATEAYQRAFDAARPDPGGKFVRVDLDARETEWEFSSGGKTKAWGFNGHIPGPTIEANVGDVLDIHLTNHLPEPTAIHWHGLRLPAAMDGTDTVQSPVQPGETFVYRFRLQDAGTFWYHPHMNETVQLERGLYGALIVRGPEEPQFDAERVLVFDDTELDRKGQIKPPGWWLEQHQGRIGKTRLINGIQEPHMTIAAGQVERWRIINAASARYVLLSIGDKPFNLIGTDGGLIPSPVAMDEVLLGPADRVELAVGPFEAGETVEISSRKIPSHGPVRKKTASSKREHFAILEVGPAVPSRASIPDVLREIVPLVSEPVAPTREVTLDWKMSLRHGGDFQINKEAHHRAKPVRVGELQVWNIINRTHMHHPFHLHGFFFQVLEVNGEKPPFLSWEDTVDIPPTGQVLIAWRPDDRPGEWMYHCHILEHHAAGMMAHFEVISSQ